MKGFKLQLEGKIKGVTKTIPELSEETGIHYKMKFCIDCKHCIQPDLNLAMCKKSERPDNTNPVYGHSAMQPCVVVRGLPPSWVKETCGPYAKWFEPK